MATRSSVAAPFAGLLFACCLLVAGRALAAPDDFESRVTEFRLKNGLQVLIYVDSSAPIVSTNVYYRVGSYYEPAGRTGISHMLEHMTFKHTPLYRPGEFFKLVQARGGRNNGMTMTYATGYFENFAGDRWEQALAIEAARMAGCIFDSSEFASEHQVVIEEQRRQDDHPFSELWKTFFATAYLASPLRQPGAGWRDDLVRLTRDDIAGWYTRYYNPANAVLVIAGDVRVPDARAKVQKHFGRLRGFPVDLPDYYSIEPRQSGERRVTVRKRTLTPLTMMGWHMPGIRDSSYLAAQVAAGILAQGRGSRLFKSLVTDSGWATSVSGSAVSDRDPELFTISISPKAESLNPRIEQTVHNEIARLKQELPSQSEMERQRNSIVAGQVFSRDDIWGIAYFLATYQICTGSWRNFRNEMDRLQRVTAEQVRDYCRQYLNPDNVTVAMLVPVPLPAVPQGLGAPGGER